MNSRNAKKPDYQLVAMASLAVAVIAMIISKDAPSLALVAGIIMVAGSLLLSEEALLGIVNFLTGRTISQDRKALARIKKSLADFNRLNDDGYSTFSDSKASLKRTIRDKKRRQRETFGEIASLFGWKNPAPVVLVEDKKEALVHLQRALTPPSILIRNFMLGANKVTVLHFSNGHFSVLDRIKNALSPASVAQQAFDPLGPASAFNAVIHPILDETPSSLRDSWGRNIETEVAAVTDVEQNLEHDARGARRETRSVHVGG